MRNIHTKTLAILWSLYVILTASADATYVGSQTCKSCHEDIYADWQESDHYRSMQTASEATILGDFSDISINFHGIDNRLFVNKGKFFVNTMGLDGTYKDFEILYTFGFYPLQQYLVSTGKGHLQALNVTWDSRAEADGGQRWFHLQPDEDINTDHPFFWPRYFSNWNSRCAECHSTDLKKGYNEQDHSYQTTWSEINVACEACHGPSRLHLELANSEQLTPEKNGYAPRTDTSIVWALQPGQVTATPSGKPDDRHINMCGGCHSRRKVIDKIEPLADYHGQYQLQILNHGLYFADGQIEDEVFVLGSFLQSKMHRKGVVCSNCHNPHSGKLLAAGNSLCATCHAATHYDSNSHHHHETNSTGSLCINCHMPGRTYMQVDDRSDHSFVIPRPQFSNETGAPNPCTDCHLDKDNQWASAALTEWKMGGVEDHWSRSNQQSRSFDTLSVQSLSRIALAYDEADIVRATLLNQMANFPSRITVESALSALKDPSPLIRQTAVANLSIVSPQRRWQLLAAYINDSSKSVRIEVAKNLVGIWPELPELQRNELKPLIVEYRAALHLIEDMPSTQLELAAMEMGLGNRTAALKAFQRALMIEPGYTPALLNLADYYRSMNQDQKAEPLFTKALAIAPDSAAVNHGYGLFLVRRQEYQAALPYLEKGTQLTGAQPRYAYVYAIALDSLGRTNAAADYLLEAMHFWPNQYDLLLTVVLYLEKAGRTDEIPGPLSRLEGIAQNVPTVQKLLQKYSR
jgi:tetratricopeptide (TPR) repeat protein